MLNPLAWSRGSNQFFSSERSIKNQMMLSSESLLFDIQGMNGEEARESAIDEVLAGLDLVFQPAKDVEVFDHLIQAETPSRQLESFDRIPQIESTARNLAAPNLIPQTETLSNDENNGFNQALKRGTKRPGGIVCIRCNFTNHTKHRRCRYCGARIALPFIETKLRKLDSYLRKILFPV